MQEKMITVFQINTIINSGSTGRIAEEIGIAIRSRGWRSIIAYGRNTRSSQSELFRIGNDWDIKFHGLKTRFFDMHGLGSALATKHLIKKIKETSPDIIHLHNIHGYYLNYPLLFDFLSKVNIPVVWTLHDCWALTGHCVHFSYVHCERWKTQCMCCPQKNQYPASIFIDRSTRNYLLKKKYFTSVKNMRIISVSNWLNNLVEDSFLNIYPHQRIYNGVDIEQFVIKDSCALVKNEYKIGREKKILLGVASQWIDRKGINDFISLRKKLIDEYIVILVGLTKKQISSLPKGIIGIQKTDNRQQLVNLYSAADIFINLTWEDNFPTTNLEAMACGTPVITYKTGGSIEAVSNETGRIVEQGDIDGIIDAIEQLLHERSGKYSHACRQRAVDLYNKQDRYAEYINLYETLINDKKYNALK